MLLTWGNDHLILLFCVLTMANKKKTSFLMGELSKKKYNTSTAVRVSLDTDLMHASVDVEKFHFKLFLLQVRKTLVDKTYGKIG